MDLARFVWTFPSAQLHLLTQGLISKVKQGRQEVFEGPCREELHSHLSLPLLLCVPPGSPPLLPLASFCHVFLAVSNCLSLYSGIIIV